MTENNQNLPPPATAMPVNIPPQLPGAPLPYATPMMEPKCPGIVKAIGIISIVVACLSTLSGLQSAAGAGMMYMLSRKIAASLPATPSVTPSAPATTTTTTVSDGGAVHISTSTVAFYSTSGGTTSTPPAAATPLTPAQVQAAVQRAQTASGNKLNTAQLASLTAELQKPNQQLISSGTAWSPVSSATVNPDGSAVVSFTGGFVMLTPQGQVSATSLTGNPFSFNISGFTCAMMLLEGILVIALAIYLFLAGLKVVRQSPDRRRRHLIYARLKIPLAICGGVLAGWMNSQIYASIGAGAPAAASMMSIMAIGSAVMSAVIGMIYPISLLIAFNTRSVREYYNAVRT